MTLGDRIKERIAELGLSMAGVSEAMGRGESFVRDIIRQKSGSPSAANLAALANELKTTPEWLLTGKGPDDVSESAEVINIWSRIPDNQAKNAWLEMGKALAAKKPETK